MTPQAFPFRWTTAYRVLALPFGVTPGNARVVVDDVNIEARFGPWLVRSVLTNVASVEASGPYSLPRTAGPAHLSLADRGLTFATNPRAGACIRFRTPVPGIEPTGRLLHPGLTVTVEDVDGLIALLEAGIGHR
ncbi:MAG: hypothetical protein ACJ74O_13260 [Frankiaceae bacterium]